MRSIRSISIGGALLVAAWICVSEFESFITSDLPRNTYPNSDRIENVLTDSVKCGVDDLPDLARFDAIWHTGSSSFSAAECIAANQRKKIPPGVSLENFQRIKKGMTLDEVRRILGQESLLCSAFATGENVFFNKVWNHSNGSRIGVTLINDAVHTLAWSEPMDDYSQSTWLRPFFPNQLPVSDFLRFEY